MAAGEKILCGRCGYCRPADEFTNDRDICDVCHYDDLTSAGAVWFDSNE